jgi:hypothetical protein
MGNKIYWKQAPPPSQITQGHRALMPGSRLIIIEIQVLSHKKHHPRYPPIFKTSLWLQGSGNYSSVIYRLVIFTIFLDQRLSPDPRLQTDS